jgi:hypothetical protein
MTLMVRTQKVTTVSMEMTNATARRVGKKKAWAGMHIMGREHLALCSAPPAAAAY